MLGDILTLEGCRDTPIEELRALRRALFNEYFILNLTVTKSDSDKTEVLLKDAKLDTLLDYLDRNEERLASEGYLVTVSVNKDAYHQAASAKAEKERLDAERKAAAAAENKRMAIAASGVSDENAANIAGKMYKAYRYGSVGEMLATENACWRTLAEQNKPTDTSAVSCAVSALAGAFVEAAYARKQMRGPTPAYNSSQFRQRLVDNMAKAGINEGRAQRILVLATAHTESVLVGLMNAGMR